MLWVLMVALVARVSCASNEVVFEDSCETKNGKCIEAFVKHPISGGGINVNVQQLQGVELAKLQVGDSSLVCENEIRKSNNDDYMSCVSQRDGTKYEFRFDDLYESVGADIQDSIGSVVCDLCGGFYDKRAVMCVGNVDSRCNSKYLARFGYSVSECSASGCKYNFPKLKKLSVYKTPQGKVVIDGNVFSNTQIRLTTEVPELLQQFSMVMLASNGLSLESFQCNKSFYKYGTDDVLRCYVKAFGDKSAQAVDFVFDDLHELSEKQAKAGRDGLACNASGGSSDGETCLGMTESMCANLAQQENVKTKWDVEQGGCVLLDAQKQKQRMETLTGVANAAIIIAGVAAAIPTGGVTLVVALSATAVGLVGSGVSAAASSKMDAYYTDVMYAASECWAKACSNNRTRYINCRLCAYNVVTGFVSKVALYEGNIDEQKVQGMSLIIDRLSEALEGTAFAFCMYAQGSNNGDVLTRTATAGDIMAITGAVVSLGSGLSGSAKVIKSSAKIAKAADALRATKTASNLSRWMKNVEQMLVSESRFVNAFRDFVVQSEKSATKANKVKKLASTLDHLSTAKSAASVADSSSVGYELYDGVEQVCETDFCNPGLSLSEFLLQLEAGPDVLCPPV
ncbi:MAG: hypothetical protein IKZ34_02190 [Alphaproteobacteria bacterium]|nr:hypothetical protein [Alphaproteobacteria bacterium]